MRYFDNHRRRLMKKSFVRGYEQYASSDGNTVRLENGVGLKLRELTIKGESIQEGEPTSSTPVSIQNAGDNGVEVKVRGINLYDARKVAEGKSNGLMYSAINNIFTVNGTCIKTMISNVGSYTTKVYFKPNTTYSIRLKVISGDLGGNEIRVYAFKQTNDAGSISYLDTLVQTYKSEGTFVEKKQFTEAQFGNYDSLRVTPYINGFEGQTVNNIVFRIDIVEGSYTASTFPEFEPYVEPQTVSIPKEVALTDGTVVPLRFAKYKNEDYLLMKNKSVKYYQYSKDSDSTKKLSEQEESIPPLEYDLTSTDFGQALLNLQAVEGTSIVEASSLVPVGGIEVGYYSYEERAYELSIKYLDVEGNELKEQKSFKVRFNSAYEIIPPHIDGYLPVQDKVKGYMEEDTEIALIYKEDKNASV